MSVLYVPSPLLRWAALKFTPSSADTYFVSDFNIVAKVRGGTRSGASLCTTCANATILKGAAESQEYIECARLSRDRVPFQVVDCNSYHNATLPSLGDMKAIAWVLRTDKSGRKIGFVTNKEWKETKDKYEALVPGDYD